MKSGLKHIDVGAELTKTEWEREDSHEVVHGNSFPGSPVERQLFYRDDEHKWYIYTGAAWTELTGGGGAGMSVHGNEYHDPDFAEASHTHSDLSPAHKDVATGVHGTGSNYLAQAPASGHLVRPFTKGWTSGKQLSGAGADADPSEIVGWQVISDWLAASAADYVDFTSLDINTHQFYIIISRIKAGGIGTIYFKLYINGDTTDTNYYTQILYATGTTAAAERQNVPYFCVGVGTDTQRGVLGFCPVTRDPDGYTRWVNQYIRDEAAAALMAFYGGAKVATVTNITSIRIAASVSGGLAAGSRITLCAPRPL